MLFFVLCELLASYGCDKQKPGPSVTLLVQYDICDMYDPGL